MTDLERLLESIAREAAIRFCDAEDFGIEVVLKRSLLPLLEAGQAMRDVHSGEIWLCGRAGSKCPD